MTEELYIRLCQYLRFFKSNDPELHVLGLSLVKNDSDLLKFLTYHLNFVKDQYYHMLEKGRLITSNFCWSYCADDIKFAKLKYEYETTQAVFAYLVSGLISGNSAQLWLNYITRVLSSYPQFYHFIKQYG